MVNKLVLVIDADIARSSGLSEHPVSSGSRALLNSVSENGHSLAMCPKLMTEWKAHRSIFARKWLSSMIAKKKVNFMESPDVTKALISENLKNEKEVEIAEKDAHLVDTALKTDKIIASNDDNARKVFCEISSNCGNLRAIKWFNATLDNVFISNYLEKNCFVPQKYYLVADSKA